MFKETSDGETLYDKISFKTYEKDVNKYLEKCKQILGKMQTNTWKDANKYLEGSVLDQEDVWLPDPCLV